LDEVLIPDFEKTLGYDMEPEGKKPLSRPRRRWKDIRKDLRETGWEGVYWINLAQDREQLWGVVNTIMKRRVT
jgi:hypothetical protein